MAHISAPLYTPLAPSMLRFTPLCPANTSSACSVSEGRVCQLLAAGLAVNTWDSPHSRNTPLHWAANFASRDMVSCLTGQSPAQPAGGGGGQGGTSALRMLGRGRETC